MLVGRVEKNQPGEDGEVQSPFQYRKAFAMDRAGTTSEIFNRLADPEDFPYLTHGKDEILLWQTEDYDRIRFAVYNSVGKLQRNYEKVKRPSAKLRVFMEPLMQNLWASANSDSLCCVAVTSQLSAELVLTRQERLPTGHYSIVTGY